MKTFPILILLLLSCVGARAQFDYITTNGTITITGYTGAGGAVTIPDTINGLPVTSIADGAFSGITSLTSVTIPSSITSIGDYVFQGCTSLTAIDVDPLNPTYSSLDGVLFRKDQQTLIQYPCGKAASYYVIPNSVTSIGDLAFYFCSSLTSVTIPNSVASIGYGAFEACSGMISVTIPEGVTTIGRYAFASCSSLTNVTIPNSVTGIGELAFSGCDILTALEVGPLNPAYSSLEGVLFNKSQTTLIQCPGGKAGSYTIPNSVTSIGKFAFYRCAKLTSVIIPDGVNGIGDRAFYDCASLTNITIPNSITSIGESAFRSCSSLVGAIIPDGVSSIERGTFYACTSLTGVTIPNSVTSIGDLAFDSCRNLSSVTIPNSVTSIGFSAFYGCASLTNVVIPNSVTSIGDSAFSACGGLTSISLPTGLISIGDYAFSGCSSLTTVALPDSLSSIGDSAFSSCTSLTAIEVDTLNPAYSSLEGVLFNKSRSTLIQYPGGKAGSYPVPNSVTSIGDRAFSSCYGLTNVVIPNSVTSIGRRVFESCVNLASVTLGDSLTSIGDSAFSACGGLTSISLPTGLISIGDYTFSGCSSLTTVALPDSLTSIGDFAFGACGGLTAIDVDPLNPAYSSLEGVLFNKSQDTLVQCPGGKVGSYLIPNGVISIADGAFQGITGLTRVTIPSSITSIGDGMFRGCTSLTAIDVDPLNPAYSSLEGVLFNKNQGTLIQFPAGKAGSYRVPDGVTSINDQAFLDTYSLSKITFPASLAILPLYQFRSPNLSSIFFEGDAPIPQYAVGGWGPGGWYLPAAIVYYRAGTSGWGSTYADRPTALWITPPVYVDWLPTTSLPILFPESLAEADDPDQDHLSNYAEMLAGTDPADRDSVLILEREPRPNDLTAEDQTPIGADQYGVYVRSVPGKTYGVEWSYSPTGPWNIETLATASTTQMRFVFDKPNYQPFYRFYRAMLVQ